MEAVGGTPAVTKGEVKPRAAAAAERLGEFGLRGVVPVADAVEPRALKM